MSNESPDSNNPDKPPEMHRHERGDNSVRGNTAPVSASSASISETLGRGAAAVILAAAFIACFLSAAAWVESRHASADADRAARLNQENSNLVAREYKQIQVQLMYTNALMIREGMVKPGDMVFGPEGNLEYDGSKFKRKEK